MSKSKCKILVYGATSAIVQATLLEYVKRYSLSAVLIARNEKRLEEIAADLKARGAESVETIYYDLNDTKLHDGGLERAAKILGHFDHVLLGHGFLGDAPKSLVDSEHLESILKTNFVSPAILLNKIANVMERQKSGTIAVIGSVAGDRGRMSNYVYGSAKAGLATFVGGMRHRLSKVGVKVVLIKPGFVSSPMTAHLKQGPLFAKPESIAPRIVCAIEHGCSTVYVPGFWRWIMLIVRNLPEFLMHKTKM